MVALSTTLLQQLAVVGLLVLSVLALWRFEGDRIGSALRRRFVMGIPWGSLVVIAGVLGFYLLFQHGYRHWYSPVVMPYQAWSYLYPTGMLTSSFAHASASHLTSNLTSALVLLPLAEYAFGHFPERRGSQSFSSSLKNPWIRALVVFPLGIFFVGVVLSLFAWGPVIGFSGIVFAAAGFALVRYPLATVVALVARQGVSLLYRTLQTPVLEQEARTVFWTPGWAEVAAQGHALGLFVGALAALLVFYRRGLIDVPGVESRYTPRPSILRLWLGALLAGLTLDLWIVWWYRGGDAYVLFRAAGIVVVLGVAFLVTAAVAASDRPLREAVSSWFPSKTPAIWFSELTRRQTATLLFVLPLVVMAMVAVPLNLATADGSGPPGDAEPIEVRDYQVVYAENVPDGMIGVVDVELFGETTQLNTSGVIVVSEDRHAWSRQVSPSRLAEDGRAAVVLGGPTWREVVFADRRGWSAAGGPTTYHVWLRHEGEQPRHVFASEPVKADPVVAGRNVSVVANEPEADPADDHDWFLLEVSQDGETLGTTGIPGANETVTAGGLTFERDGDRVVATTDEPNATRVTVASRETYD